MGIPRFEDLDLQDWWKVYAGTQRVLDRFESLISILPYILWVLFLHRRTLPVFLARVHLPLHGTFGVLEKSRFELAVLTLHE